MPPACPRVVPSNSSGLIYRSSRPTRFRVLGVGLLIGAPGVALSPCRQLVARAWPSLGTEPVALVSGMAEALMALPALTPLTSQYHRASADPSSAGSTARTAADTSPASALGPTRSASATSSRCWQTALMASPCRDANWCDVWLRQGWPSAVVWRWKQCDSAVLTAWAFQGVNDSLACG